MQSFLKPVPLEFSRLLEHFRNIPRFAAQLSRRIWLSRTGDLHLDGAKICATGQIQSIESSGVTIPEMPWFPRVGRISRGDFRVEANGRWPRPEAALLGDAESCGTVHKLSTRTVYRWERTAAEFRPLPNVPLSRSRQCTRVPQRWKCSLCVRLWLPACVAARISRFPARKGNGRGEGEGRKQNFRSSRVCGIASMHVYRRSH